MADDHWQRRFEHYDVRARSLFDRSLALVGIGVSALIALTGVVASYGRFEALLAIPPAIILLWTLAVRMLHEYFWAAAFRDYAEQEAFIARGGGNARFEIWYREAGEHIRGGMPNLGFHLIVALISGGLVAVAITTATIALPHLWPVAATITALSLLLAVGLILSWKSVTSRIKSIYAEIDSRFGSNAAGPGDEVASGTD